MRAPHSAQGEQLRRGLREPDPGECAALFVEDRPGAMDLQILTELEIAAVVRQLRVRLRKRVATAPRANGVAQHT